MTIEKRLERLDSIVAELENDRLDLAAALRLFEEGVACLREAASALSDAELKVKRLSEQARGTFSVDDLDMDD